MPEQFQIEPMGEHDCLVRVRYSGDVIESRFQASPAVVDELDAAEADEQRVIEETALYLAERQPVIDLPPLVDLDDVAAAYGDQYISEMTRRLKDSRGAAGHRDPARSGHRHPARLRIPPDRRR